MNPRRFATVAAVLCETGFVACVAGFGSSGTANTVAAPIVDLGIPPPAATSERTELPQAIVVSSAAVADAEEARAADAATDKAIDPKTIDTKGASDQPDASVKAAAEPDTNVKTADEPETNVKLASADSSQMLPEPSPSQVAKASASDLIPPDTGNVVDSLEIVDECLVVEVCIDRYLWALYQRTPKQDTIKVEDQRKVTVKRKGKTVTVTQSFSRLVDEDFAWKDPKAADKAGMPMMDYVIGGMDRSFKLKLFHVLHAAEAAGLSPGITSAFRDDYRQSIASGLKAASDRSYHGGSFRGGYGHGLAADVVSVRGATRALRQLSSESLWKWIDAHGKEFGIGRPYLDRDPPHVAPTDGKEYADHRGTPAPHAAAETKKGNRVADAAR